MKKNTTNTSNTTTYTQATQINTAQTSQTNNYTAEFERFIGQLTREICQTLLKDALDNFKQEISSANSTFIKISQTACNGFIKDADDIARSIRNDLKTVQAHVTDYASFAKKQTDTITKNINENIDKQKSTLQNIASGLSQSADNIRTSEVSFTKSAANLPQLVKTVQENSDLCVEALDKVFHSEKDISNIIRLDCDKAIEEYKKGIDKLFADQFAKYEDVTKRIDKSITVSMDSLKKKLESDIDKTLSGYQNLCNAITEDHNKTFKRFIDSSNAKFDELIKNVTDYTNKTTEAHNASIKDVKSIISKYLQDINPTQRFDKFESTINDAYQKSLNALQNTSKALDSIYDYFESISKKQNASIVLNSILIVLALIILIRM